MEQIKAENPDIKTSESGLSYVISAPGEAPMPADTSVVVVNYVGKLADGTVFDQSPEGQPATFGVNQVIPGFREGLKMLGKGGKATLYIPGNLAYGEQGVPQAGIGPNAMLIFDIEVVDVKYQNLNKNFTFIFFLKYFFIFLIMLKKNMTYGIWRIGFKIMI